MKLPEQPPSFHETFFVNEKTKENQEVMSRIFELVPTDIGKDRESEYLHWDRLKYKPLPERIENHEDWWFITKFRRANNFRTLPLKSKSGNPFDYWVPDPLQQKLHEVDQQTSGRVQIAEEVAHPATRDRYLVNSLIEEAILRVS